MHLCSRVVGSDLVCLAGACAWCSGCLLVGRFVGGPSSAATVNVPSCAEAVVIFWYLLGCWLGVALGLSL